MLGIAAGMGIPGGRVGIAAAVALQGFAAMARLLATASDSERIAGAKSVVMLVGSYDGSGNYGDVLQMAAAIDTVRRLPGRPLPLAVVEHETAAHHQGLMARYRRLFDGAAFAYFEDGRGAPVDGLEQLADGSVSAPAVVHLYGGGHLNEWWAARKAEHHTAAMRLVGERSLPVTASGLQIDEAAAGPGGPVHDLLSATSWIGLRDGRSLELARTLLVRDGAPPVLGGDDATPLVSSSEPAKAGAVVNLHLNMGGWVSEDPGRRAATVARILGALGDAHDGPLTLRPVIAYEDPRISERAGLERFLDDHGGDLERDGLVPVAPLDLLEDAVGGGLAVFRRARVTVCCSYHVALTSLLAGIPAVLVSSNRYYDQKAAGLRSLFEDAADLVGVQGDEHDVAAAAAVLADGPDRDRSVAALAAAAAAVTARHDLARDALLAALASGLERSALDGGLRASRDEIGR